MPKTNRQISAMVQGADWSAKLITAMVESISSVATRDGVGDLADLHHLATPQGRELLNVLMRHAVNARYIQLGPPKPLVIDPEKVQHRWRHWFKFDDPRVKKLFDAQLKRERERYRELVTLGCAEQTVRELRVNRPNIEFPLETLRATRVDAHCFFTYAVLGLAGAGVATRLNGEDIRLERIGDGRYVVETIPHGWLDSEVTWLVTL